MLCTALSRELTGPEDSWSQWEHKARRKLLQSLGNFGSTHIDTMGIKAWP